MKNPINWFNRKNLRIKELEAELQEVKKDYQELWELHQKAKHKIDQLEFDVESPAKFKVGTKIEGVEIISTRPETKLGRFIRSGLSKFIGLIAMSQVGGDVKSILEEKTERCRYYEIKINGEIKEVFESELEEIIESRFEV